MITLKITSYFLHLLEKKEDILFKKYLGDLKDIISEKLVLMMMKNSFLYHLSFVITYTIVFFLIQLRKSLIIWFLGVVFLLTYTL